MREPNIALVTAAGGAGIGAAIARRLAEDEFLVVVTDRNEERAILVAEGIGKRGLKCTARRLDAVDTVAVDTIFDELIGEFGQIDVLVNNTGFSVAKPLIEMTTGEYEQMLSINLRAHVLCCQRALSSMLSRGHGAIVNVASIAGWWPVNNNEAVYGAAKAAVMGLTRGLACEAGPFGVRVNAVAPGIVWNPFLDKMYGPEAREVYGARSFLRRVGRPEEIANVVSFLVSDEAAYVTGETIAVSGGMGGHP